VYVLKSAYLAEEIEGMNTEGEKTKLIFRVLGPRIMKCTQLLALIEKLIDRYELNAEIIHEEEAEDIKVENFADFPLLLINDRVLLKGRAPGEKELVRLINRVLSSDEAIQYIDGPKPKKKFKIRWTMVVFFVAVIIYLITKVSWSPGDKSNIPMNMKDSIQQEYNYTTNGKDFQFTFIEFGSENCKPCQQMKPVIEQLQNEYKGEMNYVYVDVRDTLNKAICDYYNVKPVPVHLLLDINANKVYKGYGYIFHDSLVSVIESNIE